jgi:hypothetical protein
VEEYGDGERWVPTALVSDSGCNRVPHIEEETADQILGSDGDGGGQWWSAMMKLVSVARVSRVV